MWLRVANGRKSSPSFRARDDVRGGRREKKSQRSDRRSQCRSRGDAPCYRRDLLYALVRREDRIQVPELHGRRLHRVRLRSDDEGTSRPSQISEARKEGLGERKKKRHLEAVQVHPLTCLLQSNLGLRIGQEKPRFLSSGDRYFAMNTRCLGVTRLASRNS